MRLYLIALLLLFSSCASGPHCREVPISPEDSIYGMQIRDVNRRLCLERGGKWTTIIEHGGLGDPHGCVERQ